MHEIWLCCNWEAKSLINAILTLIILKKDAKQCVTACDLIILILVESKILSKISQTESNF